MTPRIQVSFVMPVMLIAFGVAFAIDGALRMDEAALWRLPLGAFFAVIGFIALRGTMLQLQASKARV